MWSQFRDGVSCIPFLEWTIIKFYKLHLKNNFSTAKCWHNSNLTFPILNATTFSITSYLFIQFSHSLKISWLRYHVIWMRVSVYYAKFRFEFQIHRLEIFIEKTWTNLDKYPLLNKLTRYFVTQIILKNLESLHQLKTKILITKYRTFLCLHILFPRKYKFYLFIYNYLVIEALSTVTNCINKHFIHL